METKARECRQCKLFDENIDFAVKHLELWNILPALLNKKVLNTFHFEEIRRCKSSAERIITLFVIMKDQIRNQGAYAFNTFYEILLAKDELLADMFQSELADPSEIVIPDVSEQSIYKNVECRARLHHEAECVALNRRCREILSTQTDVNEKAFDVLDHAIPMHLANVVENQNQIGLKAGASRWIVCEEQCFDENEFLTTIGQPNATLEPVNVLIEADAGAGKSFLMLNLAAKWSRYANETFNFDMVLFLQLNRVLGNVEDAIYQLIGDEYKNDFNMYLQTKRVLLLLDGYDEYKGSVDQFALQWPVNIECQKKRKHNLVVVVTTRRHKTDEIVNQDCNTWRVFRLCGLQSATVINVMHNQICGSQCIVNECKRQLRIENLHKQLRQNKISNHPLFLLMVCQMAKASLKQNRITDAEGFYNALAILALVGDKNETAIIETVPTACTIDIRELLFRAKPKQYGIEIQFEGGVTVNNINTMRIKLMKHEEMMKFALASGILWQYENNVTSAVNFTAATVGFFHRLLAEYAVATFLHNTQIYKIIYLLGGSGQLPRWDRITYFLLMHKIRLPHCVDTEFAAGNILVRKGIPIGKQIGPLVDWSTSHDHEEITNKLIDANPESIHFIEYKKMMTLKAIVSPYRPTDVPYGELDNAKDYDSDKQVYHVTNDNSGHSVAIATTSSLSNLLKTVDGRFAIYRQHGQLSLVWTSDEFLLKLAVERNEMLLTQYESIEDLRAYLFEVYCIEVAQLSREHIVTLIVDVLCDNFDDNLLREKVLLTLMAIRKSQLTTPPSYWNYPLLLISETVCTERCRLRVTNARRAYGLIDTSLFVAIAQMVNVEDIAKIIDTGADINARGSDNFTPLMMAVKHSRTDCVKLFINKQCDVTMTREYGLNALHDASWQGDSEIVKLLLSTNIDVNALADKKHTALMFAALKGHEACVKLLKHASGCDTHLQNDEHKTALVLAAMQGHIDVVNILQEHD